MGQLPGPPPDFAGLFANPSIQRMLDDLTDHEFEHFVKYVFEQAGYAVEDTARQYGLGLDLTLSAEQTGSRVMQAGVSVKQYRPETRKINTNEVNSLRGGLPAGEGIRGYLVTTSTFNDQALRESLRAPRVWPIDGEHFLRYIKYVRGSRSLAITKLGQSETPLGPSLKPISPEALFTADSIVRRAPAATKVLVLANHKGGVGKTTTALNLAFGLASDDRDQQVLLVDLDPQANLTRELPTQAPNAYQTHMGDYFAGRRTLPELIRQTQFKRLWLIPSDQGLALADRGLAAGPEAELRFVRDLHAPDVVPPPNLNSRPFDWIIIDTGPSMGFFTRAALAASHYVIMPVAPGVFADVGIPLLQRTVDTMAALTGSPIVVLGCVVTQWKEDALNRQLLAPIGQRLKVLGDKVPFDRSNIERAHLETGQGKKKNLFDKKCAATKAYLEVVDEVVRDVLIRGRE